MMPPKKSKAARELDDPPEPQANGDSKGVKEEDDIEHKNIFKVEIIHSKRERTVPIQETFSQQWLTDNFEDKEGVVVSFGDTYEYYLQACQAKSCNALEMNGYAKMVKESFPDGFTVKEDSIMYGDIKEKKKMKKKPKVEGETMKLKMKDLVWEALEELGNPRDGVMYNRLMRAINVRYPALRLDINSKPLLRCLDQCVYYGSIHLVRGVGKLGRYRIWRDDEEDEQEEEETKKEEKEEGAGEGEEGAEGGEKSDEGEEKTEEGGETSGKVATKKRKKSKSKKKAPPKQASIVHSDPQRIQDCFPLALTYMSEPKIASVTRIKKYLAEYYDYTHDAGLKKALESGLEKNWWSLVSGNIGAGSLELHVDEFDPTDDDDTMGKIVNALTACTEPKQCSANSLKYYVTEYHPEFQLGEKPFKFKTAVEYALRHDIIRQLTGIGCSGTFQLTEQFIPGPHILAGIDTASDYEVVTSDEEGDLEEVGDDGFDMGYFETSNYTPRPSKRRGKARALAPVQKLMYVPQAPKPRIKKPKRSYAVQKGKKVRKTEDSDSEEEEEEDESEEDAESEGEAYRPKGSRGRKGAASKGRGRPAKKAAPSPRRGQKKAKYTEDSDESEEEEAYRPAASKSRGGASKGRGRPAAKKAAPSPRRGQKKSKYVEESEEEEEEEPIESEEEEAPKSRGRGRPAKKAAPSPRRGGKKPKYVEEPEEEEEEEEDEEEEAPALPPKKRGRPGAKAAKGKKRRR